MSLLSRDEIQTLIQTSNGPCVSIFMPTFRAGDTQQNPIRFKNLLRSAEERLAGWGLRNGDAESLLDPARRLMDDRAFWEHQEEGLALFRSPDVFKTYRLPLLGVDVDRNAPFVLAGVEHLLPRYREASKLPHVLDEGLTGNVDGLSAEELRDKAWEIVEPVLLAGRRKAAERFGDLRGTGRTSTQLDEILPAAHDGRVDTLFTARGVRVWGSYDPQDRTARFQDDQERQVNGSEDLIDRAAVQTFLNGGAVYAVEQQEVPEGYAVAAVFRY